MLTIVALLGLWLSCVGNWMLWQRLQQVAATAPRITHPEKSQNSEQGPQPGKVSVIIPAYNEAANIEACLASVLQSTDWGCDRLEVWVVDDQSEDDTRQRIEAMQVTLQDDRLHFLQGQPRPLDQQWVGKNWACHQGFQQATGDYLLFLDADVRLRPGAIATAIATLQQEQIDLLTGVLAIVCGCWAEWLAQPLVIAFITAGLPFTAVNDPTSDAIMAAGSLMLFRRSAYEHIGGHQAVADQVVEDVELARRMQQKGLKLHYAIVHELGSLRMYPSTAALWEGWTKNWYLGSQRNLPVMLIGAFLIFWLCTVPLLGLLGFLLKGLLSGWNWPVAMGIEIALVTLWLHYLLRRTVYSLAAIPPRYWWLTGVGGIFIPAIILASILKTETGWNWTWRGRPLQLPKSGE